MIIDKFLVHTHLGSAPGSPTSNTQISTPPILSADFNTGSLV